MAQEADEAMAEAIQLLGVRMRPVIEATLPPEEAARTSTEQCLSRWVRANNGDVDAASKGLMNYIHWYTQKPQYGQAEGVQAVAQGTGAELVPNEIASKKAFLVSDVKDPDGRPVVMIQVRKHDPTAEGYDLEELTLFCVYMIESGIDAMTAPVESLCTIFDMSGIGLVNVDMKAVKRILYLFTNMYPERLARCYILNAPRFFSASWTVISVLLKETTRNKVKFVDRQGLLDSFPENSVLTSLLEEADACVTEASADPGAAEQVADLGSAAEKQ